jgi:hypothetical protein
VSGASFREIVSTDRGALARAVAEGVAALSSSPGGERCATALSGGSTPKAPGADKHAMVTRCREASVREERPVPILGVSPAGELVWRFEEAASPDA